MTLLFADAAGDGFHDRGLWTSFSGLIVAEADGPAGARNYRVTNSAGEMYLALGSGEEDDGITVGFDFRAQTADGSTAGSMVYFFGDGGTVQHLHLRRSANNELIVYRGASTELARSDTDVITPGAYAYVEMKVKVADSGGTAEVRVNRQTVISFSGDTKNGGADALIDRVTFGSQSTSSDNSFTNIYILNEQGSAPRNTFLGPIRVETLKPNGNGNYSQWNGSDGNSTDNYLLVDDAPTPDDDTTYVEETTVADKDTYTMTDLALASGTVYGVIQHVLAKDSASGNMRLMLRRSATDSAGATFALGTSYATYRRVLETDPVAAGEWTVANVNGTEFGYEIQT